MAKKASHALSKRVRVDPKGVSRGVGVGHDESRFGGESARVWFAADDESRLSGRRSQAWIDWLQEARARILAIFEHTVFERVPALRRFVRRLLGRAPKPAPPPRVVPKPTGPLGAQPLGGNVRDQAYIRHRMLNAHLREHAGLRAGMAKARKTNRASSFTIDPVDPDEDDA